MVPWRGRARRGTRFGRPRNRPPRPTLGGFPRELIITLCAALSAGTVFGVVAGAAKYRLHRKRSYSDKQVAAYQRLWKKGSILLRFATGTVLALGLIWCTGFLVVGALYPDQTDYANNMAELIVCVLTVVSIIFAFYEFVRRK